MRDISRVFRLSDQITLVPVLHGCADWALALRRFFFTKHFDAVAVPLPASFQNSVEASVNQLPHISMVIQRESAQFQISWSPDELESDDEYERTASFVPIDPCQPVIALIRLALQERLPRYFIDLETEKFETHHLVAPDAYALKKVDLDQFCATLLPHLPPLPQGQPQDRALYFAQRLKELSRQHDNVLAVCGLREWPWIRDFYNRNNTNLLTHEDVEEVEALSPDPKTLIFMLEELPFVTGLHEQSRQELLDDENLSIDGIKELLLETRERYLQDLGRQARKITPQTLTTYLKYVRNLSLIENRLTPDLYSLVTAAGQIMGDPFALHLVQTARDYSWGSVIGLNQITLGIDQGRLKDGEVLKLISRLPGSALSWRSLKLKPLPDKKLQKMWQMQWNPYSQCSWPPEDELIENFRNCVMDRAQALLGQDLAQSEKFTTSIRDGLDLRETLRHWHTGDLYVKVYPPSRGRLDSVVMLFDTPADPRDYPWRTTWMAEHQNESTLCFYATDFSKEIVGPGIGLANYGGALFIYPPQDLPNVWTDSNFDFALTLEERLLAASCYYSQCRHIALLSPGPPGASWRAIARRFGKKFVHIPLTQFSSSTIAQLRFVHVLNGHEIRSFAAHFIRKA